MKVIGHKKVGPAKDVLEEWETEVGEMQPKDLLVQVKGISINPVDYKVPAWFAPADPEAGRIIGWDAAGVVTKVGDDVKNFKVGDEVFYAGEFTRSGSNAEFQLVDERIVGKKPKSLGFAEASAFPLTTITAWELLFEKLGVKEGDGEGETILILGAAGGVGSILIQLAKKLTKMTVIATASRPETIDWVKKMGADHVINHRNPLPQQVTDLNLPRAPKYVASLNGTDGHVEGIIELLQPFGHLAIIDDPSSLDLTKYSNFKLKALSFSWEFMFARSLFKTEDIDKQHQLLDRVSELIDDGTIISTVSSNLGKLTLASLIDAHVLQESGKVVGKNVMEGF